ncbi:MAG: DUF192 domain-containing protein [Microgenomates group bacterium]
MKSQLMLFVGIALIVGVAYGGLMYFQKKSTVNQNESSQVTAPEMSDAEKTLRSMDDRERTAIQLGQAQLAVEVIHETESLILGLSGRESIGSDGLLFLMPNRAVQSFWMKDMKFDIDIIWIDGSKVVGISKNVPHPDPGTLLGDLPSYDSILPATIVLEVAAGKTEEYKITVGDELRLLTVQ